MRLFVSCEEFKNAYGLTDREDYDKFLSKLNREFEKAVHPSVSALSFEPISKWKDATGNIHVVWSGQVSSWERRAEFGGEFVWLRRLASFRGKIWSKLENFTDLQLSILARNEMRKGNLQGAKNYLDAIQQPDDLPRSTILLKTKVEASLKLAT